MQILFQWDSRRGSVEDAIAAFYDTLYSEESETQPKRDDFVDSLVRGVVSNIERIDKMITAHAEHWRIERMPAVDRNVLRLAICEMMVLGTP
ncbi:MAG: transcription antitermination protein NusB, partial [Bryobacteraceae bacterium]